MQWVAINVNGVRILLHSHNSHVFIHDDAHKHYDHVYVYEGKPFYVFSNRKLVQYLLDHGGYPYTWRPDPLPQDVDAYHRFLAHNAGISEEEIEQFVRELEADRWRDEL